MEGLVRRLDDRFRLLSSGHRGAPARQRTLTAMIDWSWDLLTGPERAVLRRLAVHADGCAAESAEAVCAAEDVPEEEVLDLLVRLVDRSLVVMTERPGEGPRYRLLESVAAYAAERLAEAGEAERARAAHRRYYLELAERAESRLRGAEQAAELRGLDIESPNLRAALDAAPGEEALRLVNALAWYWFLRGRLTEALRSLEAALARDGGSPAARARALAWQAGLAVLKGVPGDWAARRDEALRLADATGDAELKAWARWFLAFARFEVDDVTASTVLLDEALAGFRALGDRWGEAAALAQRAMFAHARGDPAALERDAQRSEALFTAIGDRWGRLQAVEWLGGLAELTGDYDRAERLQHDAQRMAEELRMWPDVAMRMAWRGWIAHLRRDQASARRLFGRAHRVAVEQGFAPGRDVRRARARAGGALRGPAGRRRGPAAAHAGGGVARGVPAAVPADDPDRARVRGGGARRRGVRRPLPAGRAGRGDPAGGPARPGGLPGGAGRSAVPGGPGGRRGDRAGEGGGRPEGGRRAGRARGTGRHRPGRRADRGRGGSGRVRRRSRPRARGDPAPRGGRSARRPLGLGGR
ncbi:ATP-binding protein [Actinomadura madurae]|uniref:ATP-binding protein n=1 Tax=Actinomadura madurae TaxID=1993 RepID=UPI0020D22823|nr:hypothetical protein [Actinomadura madurae]MCP9982598.1 hypothetical protein [Actinomadura madurae]